MVLAVHRAGVPAGTLATVLPRAKFLSVPGRLSGDDLVAAFVADHPAARNNLGRWFFEDPVQETDRTWVHSKMWGRTTEDTLAALAALAPGFGYEPG